MYTYTYKYKFFFIIYVIISNVCSIYINNIKENIYTITEKYSKIRYWRLKKIKINNKKFIVCANFISLPGDVLGGLS